MFDQALIPRIIAIVIANTRWVHEDYKDASAIDRFLSVWQT